jgi:hypothetical protein
MTYETITLFTGAILLGLVHGIEPGHGWPVAASSALDRTHKWLWGLAASVILGVGHLISSVAVVFVFFFAKNYFQLHQLNEPLVLPGQITIGGPIGVFAGVLLIGLGVWEYAGHHSHDHGTGNLHHDHDVDGEHSHDGDQHDHQHVHDHHHEDSTEKRGLWGIAGFAFLLGFIHEEEFEIIGLCAGSALCLELMLAYAITVLVSIVGMTMLLVAGFTHFEQRVEIIQPYLPHISAAILVLMGLGFLAGYF